MKKTAIILALAVTALWITPAMADVLHNDMGYSIDLPGDWVVYERGAGKDKPEIVDAALASANKQEGFTGIPDRLVNQVRDLVKAGKIDYYLSKEPPFTVSVYQASGEFPTDAKAIGEICANTKKELADDKDHPVQVRACRRASLDGRTGVYMEADNYWKGTKFIQYQMQSKPGTILLFTASSDQADQDAMEAEFNRVMSTVRFD